MGFFDKVKAMKNAVTGGAAKVFVDVDNAKLGEPFMINITAEPQGCDVKFDRVYIMLRGREVVEVEDYDFTYDVDGDSRTRREIVRKSHTTYDIEKTVASAGELKDGDTGAWSIEVELPSHLLPTLQGRYVRHEYEIFAGLDCFGNDPDSGWVEVHVSN
ncbi:MAG: hypothetical protein MK193_14210 [Lentisphaeria bacterium]|nr:hypothetical protein [Lentisphaeria bacterium]